MNIIINSASYDIREHTMKNYRKNCNRVLAEHIKKIDIWKREHPNIRHKGLLIFDETECYFELYNYFFATRKTLVLHKPWMDKSFIGDAYSSELDFIIWCCPYKSHGALWGETHYNYPELIILDTRYQRNKYIQYNGLRFQSM